MTIRGHVYAGAMTGVAFRKGHGTGNDFVVLPDPTDSLVLTPDLARAVCDRRFGIGGDGVIRVAPAAEGWFMDYWNSDGSIGLMCGNGARLFARHLVDGGLVAAGEFDIVTRGGIRRVSAPADGDISVSMGPVTAGSVPDVTVRLGDTEHPATAAFVPNPHAVVFLDSLTGLGDITGAVAGPTEVYPDAANIEFVEVVGPDRVAMRVLERGSGETLSCGTGACAVAWAHARVNGAAGDDVTVEVPGGEVRVTLGDDVVLSGPAEFVAEGLIDAEWWAAHS